MSIDYFIYFFVFLFGLCIGSFLNCAIYRLEQNKKMNGRSFCPQCKHLLSGSDLLPVFSFLFLKGKCRYCQQKISWQYPFVELLTAVIFVIFFFSAYPISTFFQAISVLYYLYIISVLIVISVYDMKHYLIPDKVLIPAIFVSLIYVLANPQQIISSIFAVLFCAGFLFLIFFFSQGRAMGFGDVKLTVLIGLLLGLPKALSALFLAFMIGAIIGLIMIIFQKKGLKSEMPFGPFLVAGTLMATLWGQEIVNFYLQLF